SRGVEKRDKVRTRVIAATLSDHIKASDKVMIMGHRNSDLDSIGSGVGIWAAVSKGIKKPAFVVVNKYQTLAMPLITSVSEAYPETRVFISPQEALQEVTDKTLLIVVDTHSYSFVESPELLNAAGSIVVIDHHRMMVTHIKNSIIFYHEPYASSTSEMVAELVQYIDSASIGNIDAQALLSGIMLDTKNFVLKTGVRTFEASAYLRRRGADTVQVKRLFSNSLATYREKSNLVGSSEIYRDCAIACDPDSTVNTRIAAAQAADELLSIQGVKASFVLFRVNDDINISARSLGEINVQVILETFGGGGHLTMAGAQLDRVSMEEAKAALLDTLNEKLTVKTDTISGNRQ
ncbi:MAG: DHH family phosphoesterase, partial [Oscillospiraceae bacterium]